MSVVYNLKRCLATAAQTVAAVTLTGWSSSVRAVPGQPTTGEDGFTLIDSHTHFYDPTRAEGVPWPPRDDKLLDAMREIFGPERLIYASNWPVSERFAPLATVQGIIGDYFRSHGRRAEELVFSLSAKDAYRWVQREKTHD